MNPFNGSHQRTKRDLTDGEWMITTFAADRVDTDTPKDSSLDEIVSLTSLGRPGRELSSRGRGERIS